MLNLKVKELFFDREKVINAVGKGKRTALNRIGGFIRTTAKRSIRKRKGISQPGSPPNSHVGLLRDFLFYSYDPSTTSVVIGPVPLTQKNNKAQVVNSTVPHVLEYGGRVIRQRNRVRVETIVKARPFMAPALQAGKDADILSQAWKDVIS